MPIAPLTGLPYPNEWANPYFFDFTVHATFQDQWYQFLRENADFIFVNTGGSWEVIAGPLLDWDVDIVIRSATDGGTVTIPAGSLDISSTPNGVVYIQVPARPISAPVAGTIHYAATLPIDVDVFVLGVIHGGVWIPRSSLSAALGLYSHYIYVDAVNGSDVTGDGTILHPYETLGHACTQQAAPAVVGDFIDPITFYLAPGVYTGGVTLPARLHITIMGDNCSISTGTVYWNIDPDWWATFALSINTDIPSLRFVRKPSIGSPTIAEMGSAPGYPQGFKLFNGGIEATNSNPASVNPMPSVHTLVLNGVTRIAWTIYNVPSGAPASAGATQNMRLFLTDSAADATSWICGESDVDPGVWIVANSVNIRAYRSVLILRGVCRILLADSCQYMATRNIDHSGASYTHGRIDGSPEFTGASGTSGENIKDSVCLAPSLFGTEDTTEQGEAWSIIFDESSLISMAGQCANLTTSFTNFLTNNIGAYGRGWWNGFAEFASNHAETFIPSTPILAGPIEGAGVRLLRHAYYRATVTDMGGDSVWKANATSLSRYNPFTLRLSAGAYQFTADFDLDANGVGIVGDVGKVNRTAGSFPPPTILAFADHKIAWQTDSGRLENLSVYRIANSPCMVMESAAANSVFKRLSFLGDLVSGMAVEINLPGSSVGGVWEDCVTELAGFLHNGDISSNAIFKNCSAKGSSFGSYVGGGALHVDCAGTFEDCVSGQRSFGYSSLGSALFSGIAKRCTAGEYSFGSAASEGNGICSGTLEYCHASGRSFGYSNSPNPAHAGGFSGKALECHSDEWRCFGSGDDAASGSFTGEATDCSAYDRSGLTYSFGGSSTPAGASVSGRLVRCDGVRGAFGCCSDATTVGGDVSIAGSTFIDCRSDGGYSFGYSGYGSVSVAIAGTDVGIIFDRCQSGQSSFGAAGNGVGVGGSVILNNVRYTNCTAGYGSFGVSFGSSVTFDNRVEFEHCKVPLVSMGGESFSFGAANLSVFFNSATVFDSCEVRGNYSFGCALTGNATLGGSAKFRDCIAKNFAFGAAFTPIGGSGDVAVYSRFERCSAENNSFASTTASGVTEEALFSGVAIDCVAGDNSFACCVNNGNTAVLEGSLTRVTAGAHSFGWCGAGTGTVGATMVECDGGEDSYGGSASGGLTLATLVRCKKLDTVSGGLVLGSSIKLQDCIIGGSGAALILADDGAHVYNCTLVGGAPNTVASSVPGTPRTIKLAHSRLSHDVSADVTNLIADPHNSIDTAYVLF